MDPSPSGDLSPSSGFSDSPVEQTLQGFIKSKMKNFQRIGKGGFGQVFLWPDDAPEFDSYSNQQLVLKVIKPKIDEESRGSLRSDLNHEARILQKLKNCNIPLWVWSKSIEECGTAYLIMTKVEGDCLESMLPSNQHPREHDQLPNPFYKNDERCKELAREILTTLTPIHELGYCHRDIKPGNVHWNDGAEKGRKAILLDFGEATTIDNAAEAPFGTIGYALCQGVTEEFTAADVDLFGVARVLEDLHKGEVPSTKDGIWSTEQQGINVAEIKKASTFANFIDFLKCTGHQTVGDLFDHPWLTSELSPDLQDRKAASSQSPVTSA